MAQPVKVWPEWQIVRKIGEGGFATVYEIVRDRFSIEEHRALKVIRIPSGQDDIHRMKAEGMDEDTTKAYYQSLVNEFVKEIAFLSELRGAPNIVSYDDYKVVKSDNDIGWEIYIMMELLTPLTQVLSSRTFTENDVRKLGTDICEALSVCHSKKILHRDIKADNIFVDRNGVYKLGDFGIARTVEKTASAHTRIGTNTYMAPEVYRGQDYDTRADIYSLGILLYRLLNDNRYPFLPPYPDPVTVKDRDEALNKRLFGEPLPCPRNGSKALCSIVLKACAYHPQDRFLTVDEMKAALLNKSVRIESVDDNNLTLRIDDDDAFATSRTAFPIDNNIPVPAARIEPAPVRQRQNVSYYREGFETPPDRSASFQAPKQTGNHSPRPPKPQKTSTAPSASVIVVAALIVLVLIAGGVTVYALINRNSTADVEVEEDTRYTEAPATEITATEAPPTDAALKEKLFYVTVNINYDFNTAVPMRVYIDGVEDEAYREDISASGSFKFTISATKDTAVTLTLDNAEYYRCDLDYASGQITNEVYSDNFYSEHIA